MATHTQPKVAAVTGANKGIGYGIVKALVESPQFNGIVYLTARDKTRGEAAAQELAKVPIYNLTTYTLASIYAFQSGGVGPRFHQLDINDLQSVETFRDFIRDTHGGLDILVNNAGIGFNNEATESFAEQAEASIRVNFFGTLNVCRALFPLLRPGARIVNMSSSLGLLPKINGIEPHSQKLRETLASPVLTIDNLCQLMNNFVSHATDGTHHAAGWPNSTYAVSKVGVSALARIQQREFDAKRPGQDIIVNCVHPGYVATDMNNHNGELTIEQGAEAPTWLALLPKGHEARGAFVWRNKEIVDWVNGVTPTPY